MRKSIFNAAAVLGAVSASITAAAFYLLNYFDVGGAVTAIAILAVIIIAAVAAANQIAKSITGQVVSQMEDIDLENIGGAEVCGELKPFLERIEEENLGKEKSEQMRREFSANVSHELKTPLTSISGYAQMINNGMAKEEDFLTFTRRIEKEASRLILLINDIIKLSNLDEQNGAPEAQKIDLSIAAQETIVELEKAANDKNVRIFYSGKETYINGSRTLIG
ncbi:MAG: hypothetical protein LIO59_02895, partial [Oscillospiraceae bacterium]|nr:hypothetical protein [Oscillospiraceae bacterium]